MSRVVPTGSLFETLSQATVSRRQGLMTEDDHKRIYEAAEKQSRMLRELGKSLTEG